VESPLDSEAAVHRGVRGIFSFENAAAIPDTLLQRSNSFTMVAMAFSEIFNLKEAYPDTKYVEDAQKFLKEELRINQDKLINEFNKENIELL